MLKIRLINPTVNNQNHWNKERGEQELQGWYVPADDQALNCVWVHELGIMGVILMDTKGIENIINYKFLSSKIFLFLFY